MKSREQKPSNARARLPERSVARGVRRIPQQSLLYDRVIPLLMIVLGLILVGTLVLAAALVLGLAPIK